MTDEQGFRRPNGDHDPAGSELVVDGGMTQV
jgi:hypothetical protein